jgi:hypothetical protein
MHISDFYASMKERTTDAAELDAREWHIPHKALIAELAELGAQPATKAVADRIDWIENELEGYRDDVIHDLACAYEAEGDDDAWENARRETPCLISLVEAYFEERAA